MNIFQKLKNIFSKNSHKKEFEVKAILNLTSDSIDQKHVIKDELNVNPLKSLHLKWNPIEEAKAYAILIMDKDATGAVGNPFLHWAAFVMDENITELNEGESTRLSSDILVQFENNTTKQIAKTLIPEAFLLDKANCYYGPTPPDRDHLYEICLVALKEKPVIKPNKKLLYPYFEELVLKSQPIQKETLFFIGKQVKFEDNKISLASDKVTNPHLLEGGKFFAKHYKPNAIQNVQVEGLEEKNGEFFLDSNFYTELNKVNKRVILKQFKQPEISFDKVEGAKSYVVLLNNSQSYDKLGIVLVNWNVYGIEQPKTDQVVLSSKDDSLKTALNSFSKLPLKSGLTSLFATMGDNPRMSKENKREFELRSSYGSKYFVEKSEKYSTRSGYYTLFIYATTLEPDQYKDVLTQQDILQNINNKVIATKTIKFKLS